MKQYNFKKPLLNLDGTVLKDKDEEILINKALAMNLSQQSKGDALKVYDWSRILYDKGVLSLDRSDARKLKQIIEGMENASVLFKAQLLEVFEGAEIENEKPDE